jgi:hypothetical protein
VELLEQPLIVYCGNVPRAVGRLLELVHNNQVRGLVLALCVCACCALWVLFVSRCVPVLVEACSFKMVPHSALQWKIYMESAEVDPKVKV